MKYFFDNIIFFILFFFIGTIFPEWNFENASFNLLNETNNYRYSYIIYNKDVSNYELTLRKTIYKEGSVIKDENNLDITNKNNNNEKFSISIDWEDINNIFFYNNILQNTKNMMEKQENNIKDKVLYNNVNSTTVILEEREIE